MCKRGTKIREFALGKLSKEDFEYSEQIAIAMAKSAPFQRLDPDMAYCYGLCHMLTEYPEDFDEFDLAQMKAIARPKGVTDLAYYMDIMESHNRYAKLFLMKRIEWHRGSTKIQRMENGWLVDD